MFTILIVEDHSLSRQALMTLLGYYGHRLLEATDGAKGLELARAEHPDLIITDIVMPTMDGIEFVRHLRAEKGLEETPVIFYTATYRLPEASRLVKGFGHSLVIPKPSEPADILRIVNDLLGILLPGSAATPAAACHHDLLKGSAGLQLATLMDFNFHLINERDPKRLLELACDAFRSIMNCRCIRIALLETNGGIDYFGQNGLAGHPLNESLPLAEILTQVVSRQQTLRRHNPEEAAPFASLLIVPFATQGRVYGWVCIIDRPDHLPFSDGDEEMAVSLSSQVALAYENLLLVKEQQQNTADLSVNLERLRLAIESAELGTWEYDPVTGSLGWSDRCKAFFGLAPDASADYETFLGRLHPDDRQRVHEIVQQALDPAGNGEYDTEYRTVWPDGTERWIMARGKALFGDVDGRPHAIRFIGTVTDITARKRHEEELLRALHGAEAAKRAKRQFLANMSHELRTPMTGVLGMLEIALGGSLDPQQRDYIETAYNSGRSLLRILNDILDLSKIEANKLAIEERPFSLRECVAATIDILTSEARRKGLEFGYSVATGVPETVVGDETRLRQVLTNLLGNAVKFTEHGKVALRVTAGGTSGEKREITFTIVDTGIGIPAEKQHILFGSFSQVDDSHSRIYGGTGLGLAISREIVELMGGEITLESAEGKGSTFSFTVSLGDVHEGFTAPGRPVPAMDTATHNDEAEKAHILIAEDDPLNRKVLGLMFKRSNFHVDFAEDGQKAVEMWEKGGYDVILMDVQMPRMDGFTATGVIREREQTRGGHTPIIALTAHAMKEDEERCFVAGMDAHVAKPIDFMKCFEVIGELLAQRSHTDR